MSTISVHDDWLSLIEISGPFLAVPVLKEAFPQGLEELDGIKRKRLRQAYEEWREALELEDAQFAELHVAWIDEVLSRGLELDEDGKGDVLKRADWCAANLKASLPEHGVTLSPDLSVIDKQRANKPLLLIQTYAQDVDLDATLKQDGWAATPADRMVQMCRSLGCRLGLVTNGERWMLVDAPVGAVSTFASWYARIWSQEPITLQAFVHLLGIRRFFVDESEQLHALFDRSLKFQDEVTDALGEQVRRAVEVLIQTLDKADQDRNRELLHDVKEPELYEAALTVMMRLVFLLSAEERGLLLMGDERYEANYALSTLRMQLRKESEEILERRWDAWSRLLAIFRAVFGGIEHENLRLPALGGSLFDPDRFPFLEGRAKGSNWRSDAAKPLPIDNRTVLLLLEAIQQFQGRTLSYRALDVEQIGYVYEGLLERTVKRTDEVTLELDATKNAKTPWVKLAELDSAGLDGATRLAELLQERSGSSASRVRNDLAKTVDDTLADRLLTACQGDTKLRDRVKPYAHLLRTDPWGYPLVYPAGAFIVTTGSDRRETGTHYTPKSLTEAIVAETLTPVAYVGPAEGTPRDQWVLKSPSELLDLKICDPAMGSGAFLVQACRWLSDRLVEAWSLVEATGKIVSVDGEVLEEGAVKEPLPRDSEARTVIARRLIAERCLYGVDLNPLAVELAKLSIWLVTLAKGRPFGFLDHNLRCGDSLLGIHRLDQLTQLSMNPTGQGQLRLFGQNVEQAVREAIELRSRLREMPIRDIRDVEAMAHLDAEARRRLEVPECIADAFIGEVFTQDGNGTGQENALASLTIQAGQAVNGDQDALASMRRNSDAMLSIDLPVDKPARRPFHWPVEFPEVFSRHNRGFDAVVGNPPFLGNSAWKSVFGSQFQSYVAALLGATPGKIDLSIVFHRHCSELIRSAGCYGLIAANNMTEGSSTRVGTEKLLQDGDFVWTWKDLKWPGRASVVTAVICFFKGRYAGAPTANGQICARIGSKLLPELSIPSWSPQKLKDCLFAFKGVDNSRGLAFVINEKSPWFAPLSSEPSSLLRPYITGDDITSSALHKIERWALDIGDSSIDSVKETHPVAFRFLDEVVKPSRSEQELKSYKGLANRWWQFWNHRAAQMRNIRKYQNFVAFSRVSKFPICMLANPNWIYTEGVVLIENSRPDTLAICLSSFFTEWLVKTQGAKFGVGATLRLSIGDGIETFPLPGKPVSNAGIEKSRLFHELSSKWCEANNVGLTHLCNLLSDSKYEDPSISTARQLLFDIDLEVCAAYGWSDFHPQRGFYDAPFLTRGLGYVLPLQQRDELLSRLIELNQSRFNTEGLNGSQRKGNKSKGSKEAITTVDGVDARLIARDLFDGEGA